MDAGMDDDDQFRQAVARRRAEASPPQPPRVVMGTGGDPALRLALINAGVITHEQLMIEEEKLRAARESGGIVVSNPGQDRSGGTAQADPLAGSRAAKHRGGSAARS